MIVNKVYATIRSIRRRTRLACKVFREDPDNVVIREDVDDVVTLTRTEDGSVEFQNRFGVGIAGNHRTALEGIAQQYGLFHGQSGIPRGEDPEDGDDGD